MILPLTTGACAAGRGFLQYWLYTPLTTEDRFLLRNDHEADWEKVFIYLSEGVRRSTPGVGATRPKLRGDNSVAAGLPEVRRWGTPGLRRRWFHASIARRVPDVTVRPLPAHSEMTNGLRSFWKTRLGQYVGDGGRGGGSGYFSIPFVDYARGDGLSVGEGGDRSWDEPRLIDHPIPDWVSGYRGLWGLYARDPFEGEDAPAGPMYNRDKSVARAWYDPVGWAGLDKVAPPTETLLAALEQREDIVARCALCGPRSTRRA